MALVIHRLTESDERFFWDAIERTKESDPNFALSYKTTTSFREYLEVLRRRESGIDLPQNYVPDTLLFGFVGQEIVGRVSIRHRLNDPLLKVGGHIGYVVVPQFRGRGYGTELDVLPHFLYFPILMLRLGIEMILKTSLSTKLLFHNHFKKLGRG